MKEGEVLICVRRFSDGSLLIEHRTGRGFLLCKYIGYYQRGGTYKLYPARGERHYSTALAGEKVAAQLIR